MTVTVRDASGDPVAKALASGVFNDGPSVFRCTTNGNGTCRVSGYQWTLACLTFSVKDIQHATLIYQPAANQDPDGDSDGTSLTVCRPGQSARLPRGLTELP